MSCGGFKVLKAAKIRRAESRAIADELQGLQGGFSQFTVMMVEMHDEQRAEFDSYQDLGVLQQLPPTLGIGIKLYRTCFTVARCEIVSHATSMRYRDRMNRRVTS